jgi:predicted Zn-dependent protease
MDAQRTPSEKVRSATLLICLALGGLLSGCATVDLPNITEQGFKIEDDEKRLFNRARETVEYLDHSGVIYPDPQLEAYLTKVAQGLLPQGLRDTVAGNLDIRVKVIHDPDINAISLPNGRIYFHTGMLAVMENEADLATIMAHELVHVLNRHVLKEKRSTDNKAAFFNATLGGIFPLGYQLGALSSISGFSKQLELEADEQGFAILTEHGYAVEESPKVFEAIKAALEEDRVNVPFFFSTHPKVVTRLNNYKKLIEAHPSAVSGKTNEAEFQQATQRMFFDTLALWMNNGRSPRVERYIEKYLRRHPASAEGFYIKGELYRQRQDRPKGTKKRDKGADYTQALQAYDSAIEHDPRFSLAYAGKGKVLRAMNEDAEAKKNFARYLELDPQSPERAYIESYLNH